MSHEGPSGSLGYASAALSLCVSLSLSPCFPLRLPCSVAAATQPVRSKDEARRLLAIFIPDVGGHTLSSFEAGSLECKLTVSAVLSQLREVWFPAHLIGW